MPLSSLQSAILLALAAHRNPESDVAGGSVLDRDGPRISADIVLFGYRLHLLDLATNKVLAGRVVQPAPDKLAGYDTISGRRRGHWPTSPDIAGAMIDDEAGP